MSSKPETDRRWSLTRRMTVMFALTTLTIVALYGVWSSYLVIDRLRQETRQFLDHELEELEFNIAGSDRSASSIRRCVREIVGVSGEKKVAARARDASGRLITEQGEGRLLDKLDGPIAPGLAWDQYFFSRRLAAEGRVIDDSGTTIEVLVNTSDEVSGIYDYLWTVFFAFLGAVALSGLAGRFTASRGLKGLRDVIAHAQAIGSPAQSRSIELRGAPDEIREVATALNKMLERINQATEGMHTFTAGLAHELRSPLQNLLGETEVTLLSERTPGEYRQLLRSNLEDLRDLSDAVDNLVAYCRTSDPDRQELRTEYFDLAAEARLRLEGLKREALRKGITVEIRSSGNTGLFADREGCLRVVRNLVGNAVVWAPPDSVIEVLIQGNQEGVGLFVLDRGPGVPAELQDRIFEPFFSGRLRQGKRAGYGLGLAICRSILEEHGGQISFENNGDGGTAFIARFPRGSSHQDRPTSPLPV